MKHFYAEDLNELVVYRSKHFIEKHLPAFTSSNIEVWNMYNEDMLLLPFDTSHPLNKVGQEPFYNAAETHNVDYRVLYTKVEIEGQPYILMSRVAMIEKHDLIGMLIFQYGTLFVILTVSLVAIQRFLSKKLWKPFYDSLEKIERFDLEQGIIPQFKPTNTVEFARLNENLSKLISNNLQTYTQQKEFIENASHELQTPIAVFQSQLDLLLQNQDLTEAQGETIQSLYAVSSRLSRLNKNLLLLAKIDNSQFKEAQEIDFNEVLNGQLFYLKELAENNGIKVLVENSYPLRITANKTLVESLIGNVVVNAIRHNTANGSIAIAVTNNSFSVSNTGTEVSLDPLKIFRRFSRTSEEKNGNGLGLSIAYQICKIHGWRLEYAYTDNRHVFTVLFNG